MSTSNADKGSDSAPVPSYVHFISGGIAGTVGAVVTCPLEVVKTRLQSSKYSTGAKGKALGGTFSGMKMIWQTEGWMGLYRGVGPTLVGVVPSRAVYFMTYSKAKDFIGENMNGGDTSSTMVHLMSAMCAGISVNTLTNPIWMVKTRVQLQEGEVSARKNTVTSVGVVKQIFREEGFRGFYRGLTASYMGISETALQFAVYERLKSVVKQYREKENGAGKVCDYMAAAGLAKLIASTSTYPHEVVRTRLRERHTEMDRKKYSGLIQTFKSVVKYEGVLGLYSGKCCICS